MDARVKSGITLTVMLLVLVFLAVYGFSKATAPFPKTASTDTTCQNERVKKRLYRKEVAVSVYNASNRGGLAGQTLDAFVSKGFLPGDPGNAPKGTKVRRVQVWAKEEDDSAALLVASMFRPQADIIVSDDPLGPGVDVIVGKRYKGLRAKAPRFIKLAEPIVTCLD